MRADCRSAAACQAAPHKVSASIARRRGFSAEEQIVLGEREIVHQADGIHHGFDQLFVLLDGGAQGSEFGGLEVEFLLHFRDALAEQFQGGLKAGQAV